MDAFWLIVVWRVAHCRGTLDTPPELRRIDLHSTQINTDPGNEGGGTTSAHDALAVQLEGELGGQFHVERLLGRGGMGAVYLAHDVRLNRKVAIKVLPPEIARLTADSQARFMREAQAAAQLTHRHIVPLHSVGQAGDMMFFVMGFVRGETLKSLLTREGTLSEERTRRILFELADALSFAHAHGIVHRDIKPDNVMIDETGKAVLTDFGIARFETSGELTAAGVILGTPQYMSPEQASGEVTIDGRSDLYSLAVLGYHMLSGRLPFDGTNTRELLVQHIMDMPMPIQDRVPDLADDLSVLITRNLSKAAADRSADAASVRDALNSSQATVLFRNRAWYDGALLSYVLPAAFVVSILVVGAGVGDRAHSSIGTALGRARTHAFSAGTPTRRANSSTGRETGESSGAARIMAPLRTLVFGEAPLPRYALRFYVTSLVMAVLLTLVCGVPLAVLAAVQRDTKLSIFRPLRILLRQPPWWTGWVPNAFRHPSLADMRKHFPKWLVLTRTIIDATTIYHLLVILPVVIVLFENTETGLVDAAIHDWPYVRQRFTGTSLLDRQPLFLGLSIFASAASYLWSRKVGMPRLTAWRIANGSQLAATSENVAFWRDWDAVRVAGPISPKVVSEPVNVDDLVKRIDTLVAFLPDDEAAVREKIAVATRAIRSRTLTMVGEEDRDGARSGIASSPHPESHVPLLETALRQLWLELEAHENARATRTQTDASQFRKKIAVLCADLNELNGSNNEPTIRM